MTRLLVPNVRRVSRLNVCGFQKRDCEAIRYVANVQPRKMSSIVRVGTSASITSTITPVLFLSIVQNLHACLSRASSPPNRYETEQGTEQEREGREKTSEWITGESVFGRPPMLKTKMSLFRLPLCLVNWSLVWDRYAGPWYFRRKEFRQKIERVQVVLTCLLVM